MTRQVKGKMAKPIARYTGLENIKGRSSSRYLGNVFDSANGANFSETHTTDSSIPFDNILLTSITPRSINQYSQTRIDRLAKSIRNTGNRLINPITVARVGDLDPEGSVIQKFISKGIDPTKLEYIIVAGERRYRAFCLLRDEENKKDHELGWKNPFETITANILTPEEALTESIFYEESNTQTRQLTPEEALRHFENAQLEVDTDDKKYLMLLEMDAAGVDLGTIPLDKNEAVRKFRMSAYCVYWMERELGIAGWNESTVKNYLAVLNKCCQEVKDAIYDTEFSLRAAGKITSLTFAQQRYLLDIWKKKDYALYNSELASLTKPVIKPVKKVTRRTAARDMEKFVSSIRKEKEVLLEDQKKLSGTDREIITQGIELIDSSINRIEELITQLKVKKEKAE